MDIKIAGLNFDSIVDGPGLRNTLFVQGCSHHCPGCHNPETWSTTAGELTTTKEIVEKFLDSNNKSVTFSGGEPFEQAEECYDIATQLKQNNFNLWAYSGYTFDQILEDPSKKKFLETLDVLVDGRFILEQKSLALNYKGSKNQRVILVQESLDQNRIVLYRKPKQMKPKKLKLYI